MSKIEILKMAGSAIISIGVGALLKNGIANTKAIPKHGLTKLCAMAGSFVLSSMITDKAVDYAEEKIDSAVNSIREMVEKEELN